MTAANNFFSDLYHLADSAGMDTIGLLQKAGIDRVFVDSPTSRIETEKLAIVVESIWDYLQDESLGLSSEPIPRGSFFMAAKVSVEEPTLRRALEMSIRFYSMVTKAFEMKLEEEGEYATLIFSMSSPELDPQHLFAEINLMAWHRYASWLISESVTLTEIFFDYPTPRHVSEYAYLFPGQHRFSANDQGFSFKRHFLDRRIIQNRSSVKAFINRCPRDLFNQPKTDFRLSFDLQRVLTSRMKIGFPGIEEAAVIMHITKRSLIRKLKDEGTSYQRIKDLVRRDRAIYLLTNTKISLGEIAEHVGFSDPSVLARAFKQWTGFYPREYRTNTLSGHTRGK